MPFLPPNRQRQSTEGKIIIVINMKQSVNKKQYVTNFIIRLQTPTSGSISKFSTSTLKIGEGLCPFWGRGLGPHLTTRLGWGLPPCQVPGTWKLIQGFKILITCVYNNFCCTSTYVHRVLDHFSRHINFVISQELIMFQVHHFTLYDSTARGFVRPFCLAYVTPDYRCVLVDTACINMILYMYCFTVQRRCR